MLSRLTGVLESIETDRGGGCAVLRPLPEVDAAIEILTPGYLARALATRVGERVTFHTTVYLEGQGQGTSFVPRIIGFGSTQERDFFDVFTTVKGIGNRKALRALAEPPGVIAAAIGRRDARALTELPEIGKRMAETIVAELYGKVDAFAMDAALNEGRPRAGSAVEGFGPSLNGRGVSPAVSDAIDALCALGETRAEAERKVARAVERQGGESAAKSAGDVLAWVYAGVGGRG
jgi:Holliday junction DNA helicase RuvA